MNFKKVILLCAMVLIISTVLFAEDLRSMIDNLESGKLSSKKRIELLLKICEEGKSLSADSLLLYSEQAYLLSDKENDIEGKIRSFMALSKVYVKRKDLKKAYENLMQAEQLIITGGYDKYYAELHYFRGIVQVYKSEFSQAKSSFLNALQYKSDLKKASLFRIYNNLANIYYYQIDYASAMRYYLMQEELARREGNKKELGYSLVGIGNIYNDLGDFESSLPYYEEAEEIFEETDGQREIYTIHNNLGTIYSQLGEEEKARAIYDKILPEALAMEDHETVYYIYNNLGVLDLLYTHDFESALKYSLLAEEYAEKYNSTHDIAMAKMNIGSAYKELKKYDLAMSYLHEAYDLAKAVPAEDILSDTVRLLLKTLADRKQDKELSDLVYEYSNIQKKIGNQSAMKVSQIQQDYIKQKFENDMEIIRMEKEKDEEQISHQRLVIYISVIFLIILSIVAAYLIKINKKLITLRNSLQKEVDQGVQKLRQQDSLLIMQNHQAAMGEMLSAIAHQWKQPLNGIGLIIQNLEDAWDYNEVDDKLMQESSAQIMQQIQFMADTITSFRNYYIMGDDEDFTLQKAVELSLRYTDSVLKNHNIAVKKEIDPGFCIYGRVNLLVQVLLVLIHNARDAFREQSIAKPLITITAREGEDKTVCLELQDNAGGIKEEIIDKIFQPYFSTKESDKGTGIGLYIAHSIIKEKFRGDIKAENTKVGTLFTLSFPIKNQN